MDVLYRQRRGQGWRGVKTKKRDKIGIYIYGIDSNL